MHRRQGAKRSIDVLAIVLFMTLDINGQGIEKGLKWQSECLNAGSGLSTEEIRRKIELLLAQNPQDAESNCAIAELMKRVGDYRAEAYYRKAIQADDTEPAYNLYFADYLRNFRGAQHPLFPEAESHYLEALRKLGLRRNGTSFDNETQERLERSLVALYQRDGVPLFHSTWNPGGAGAGIRKPVLFLSTVNEYARSTIDFDRIDDARSFTSEALESESRVNRPLTEAELRSLLRVKEQFDTFNRFRFRQGNAPVIDFFYRYRNLDDAAITDFRFPSNFNDVTLHEYGVSVEKPLNLAPYFDVFLKSTYKRIDRKGLIETLPEAKEAINHIEANAVASRFFGPDKVSAEFIYVYQDINQRINRPDERDRTILAGKFTYQVFRPLSFLKSVYENRFETRGLDLFGGIVRDVETFGVTDLKKKDIFFGGSLKGIGTAGKIDVTIQPTFFTAEVEGSASKSTTLFRTNAVFLYRFKDEEATQRIAIEGPPVQLAFVHLVVPFSDDRAVSGLDSFENTKIGIGLNGKFFTTGIRRTSFLASVLYNRQSFPNLRKSLNLVSINLSMGF
jgi:hypothetical protein